MGNNSNPIKFVEMTDFVLTKQKKEINLLKMFIIRNLPPIENTRSSERNNI